MGALAVKAVGPVEAWTVERERNITMDKRGSRVDIDNHLHTTPTHKVKLSINAAIQLVNKTRNGAFNDNILPMPEFQFWHRAIFDDDENFVRDILSRYDSLETKLLLNGRFEYEHTENFRLDQSYNVLHQCRFELPILLTASFLSYKVLKLFLENGVDILCQDVGGNNIFHGIIISAALQPEKDFCNLYKFIVDEISLQKLRTLLYMENIEGYRPLEYAAKMETFDLMECILRTRDVYAIHKSTEGAYEHVWYDITDYETTQNERLNKSPLTLLTQMSKIGVNRINKGNLLNSPLMQSWNNLKKVSNRPVLLIWFVFRLIYHALVFFSAHNFTIVLSIGNSIERVELLVKQLNLTIGDAHLCAEVESFYSNFTDCERPALKRIVCNDHTPFAITSIVMVASVIMVCFDIYITIKKWYYGRSDHKNFIPFPMRGEMISTAFYFRVQSLVNVTLVLTFLLLVCLRFLPVSLQGYTKSVIFVMFISTTLLNIWALLFFFQCMPYIGHFVIAVQKMLADMASFFAIFLIFLFGFSQAFTNILFVTGFCNNTGFENLPIAFYSTFTVMLNMVDFSNYVDASFTIAILHMSYVLVVAVLLLNFLIALMSSSVIHVNDNKDMLMTLQKLHIALLLEYRTKHLWKYLGIHRYRKKCGLLWENGRLYIPCMEILER